ncbi:MAG: HlyD family efflux transporter periplasmic adaptor subunit [Breznakibacter sp.]
MKEKYLFPPEIIHHTVENLFVKHSKPFYAIYFSTVAILLACLASLPFIWVEISSQSRGIIKSANESSQIQAVVYAKVLKSKLKENKAIMASDTLLVLDAGHLDQQITAHREKIAMNTRFMNDLKALANGDYRPRTSKYQSESNQYRSKLNELSVKLQLLKKEFELAEHLYNEKVNTQLEYFQKKNQYESALSEKEYLEQQYKNGWQAELTQLETENQSLTASIAQVAEQMHQYVITSPCNGTLMQITQLSPGSFVVPGQILAQISTDTELLAECYVSSSDIGFISVGQPVRFHFDTFNHHQWGLGQGEVTAVSADVVSIDNQPFFKVKCSLDTKQLSLKNGRSANLHKGMTLTGRFVLTKRTLAQLLFDKLDNWMNPSMSAENRNP